ncbi:hypothetical protein OUZ56_000793 [Daphnia magna]|uniref:Uncharacterized protein n=1 Tax=Daphnia magna TaxID=35525 RepID=A0ABR0A0S1_9CRUS|nr:hypothetical protein OUZ56_000793 [Daphnia magna]
MYTESVLPEEKTFSEILWRIGDQAVPYRELPERNAASQNLTSCCRGDNEEIIEGVLSIIGSTIKECGVI